MPIDLTSTRILTYHIKKNTILSLLWELEKAHFLAQRQTPSNIGRSFEKEMIYGLYSTLIGYTNPIISPFSYQPSLFCSPPGQGKVVTLKNTSKKTPELQT
jgi:hypothetical protein